MNVKELKSRLDSAIEKAQIIPLNFWWAMTQVAVELKATGEHSAASELKNVLAFYKLPAVLHKLLHNGYYHPGCAEDLKVRAQVELAGTNLSSDVQQMHEELHCLAGLECRYSVWDVQGEILNRDKIYYAQKSKLQMFVQHFNRPKPQESVLQQLAYGFRSDDRPDLSSLASWFCFLYENRIPSCDRAAAAELFKREQAQFVRAAILNNCYPDAVYEQCKKVVGEQIDYHERLAQKWYNMIRFIAQIKPGDLYYYPAITENGKLSRDTWIGDIIDMHRFEKGLCFHCDIDARRWGEGML